MAEVKWIKIVTDIFDDEKTLMIETLPNADSIIVIWFKLLCLAGKQNNSGVFQLGHMPYTDEMFATVFRRPVNTVRMALKTFEQFGMVEIINNTVTIPNWNKHQALDSYEKKKERDRIYQSQRRADQKLIAESMDAESSDNRLTIGRLSDDASSDSSSDVAISDKIRLDKIRLDKIREEYIGGDEAPQPAPQAQAKKKSTKPTLEEVKAYVAEKGYTFDPEKFWAYYETQGWKLSNGNTMKSWEACCVTWEKRQNDSTFKPQMSKPINKQAVRGGFSGESSFDPDDFFNKAVNRGQNQ